MIAYKVFQVKHKKLYPYWVDDYFEHYPLGFTHTRADNCGPFACCLTLDQARWWQHKGFVIHKVRIKESLDNCLWIDNGRPDQVGHNSILADEFEILERVK